MQGRIWQETLSNEIHEVSKFGAPSKALAAQASRGFTPHWEFSGRFHSYWLYTLQCVQWNYSGNWDTSLIEIILRIPTS